MSMPRRLRAALVALATLPGTAPAQDAVRGVIVDEHGAPVAGAEVRDAAGRRVVSSAGGAFAALAAGRIAVRRLGFTPLDTVLG
ncbi:MAG: hypothetical protein ACK54K_16175, partial [Gemmatimonadaceae bacterium]